ncbi:MAG: HEAT repeat domain-containing protein [Chloroflexi bacterium]|nr:HEAT repeat domain-containing protein [Chloroflexota bacterium]
MEELLAKLRDGDPVAPSQLMLLSELSEEGCRLWQQEWPYLPQERRQQLVRTLAQLGEDCIESDFGRAFHIILEDEDETVVLWAIKGLSYCEDRWLIGALVKLLHNDARPSVRAAATAAMERFALLAALGKLSPEDETSVAVALISTTQNQKETEEVRCQALRGAGALELSRVKEIIHQAYQSSSLLLRLSAVYAMGMNCNPYWLPTLIAELDSPHQEMRQEAARALGELEDERAVPHLALLLQDPYSQAREAAFQALSNIGGEEAKQLLLLCLKDPSPQIRAAARRALRQLNTRDNLSSLFS